MGKKKNRKRIVEIEPAPPILDDVQVRLADVAKQLHAIEQDLTVPDETRHTLGDLMREVIDIREELNPEYLLVIERHPISTPSFPSLIDIVSERK